MLGFVRSNDRGSGLDRASRVGFASLAPAPVVYERDQLRKSVLIPLGRVIGSGGGHYPLHAAIAHESVENGSRFDREMRIGWPRDDDASVINRMCHLRSRP